MVTCGVKQLITWPKGSARNQNVQLKKVYGGRVEALEGASLEVRKSELSTLLGPNGTSKTAFLRIVVTQLMPTSGEAYVLGYDVPHKAKENAGLSSEKKRASSR